MAPRERSKALSRFAPSEAELSRLLAEARANRGMSLWRDAMRRLRRNRGAWMSLVFLAIFVGASFLAPLLPLSSPMALDLQSEPRAPLWPWSTNPRTVPVEGKKPAFGSVPTASLRSLADDGWQHRTFVDVVLPLVDGAEPAVDEEVAARVGAVAGRRPRVYVRAGDDAGTQIQRHAFAQVPEDRARRDWTKTGGRAILEASLVRPARGAAHAWLDARALPDLSNVESLTARTWTDGIELLLVPRGGDDAVPLRYRLRWRAASDARIVGVTIDGVALPPDARRGPDGNWVTAESGDDEPVVDDGSLPGAAPSPAAVRPDELAIVHRGQALVLADPASIERLRVETADGARAPFERRRSVVDEERGIAHDDLGRRAGRELAALGRGSVAALAHTDGIWELGALDRALLAARVKLFGLWQSGPLLGTDAKGRDVLSRIVWGSRISIQVSVVATLCSLLIGVTWGAFAGLAGGRTDNLMMRIVDVLYSVPFIFVVIFLITIINEYRTELADRGIGYMTVFYVVIGAIYWLTMARVVRGQVLSLKNQEFIEAARVLGASTPRILFAHLVPNVLSVVIVYLTLTIPAVMLFEAFLSFLGLGVEPPRVSWGLLAVDATDSISAVVVYWWLIVFPSLAMGSVLLALNVLGDGLRDALDPKLRGKD